MLNEKKTCGSGVACKSRRGGRKRSDFAFDLNQPRYLIARADLDAEMKAFAEWCGRHGLRGRKRDYLSWPARKYSPEVIALRSGSWGNALRRMGLPLRPRDYTPVELMEALERAWRELGRAPGATKLKKRTGISSKPYESRWGSLRAACIALSEYKAGRLSRAKLLAGIRRVGDRTMRENRRRGKVRVSVRWMVFKRDGRRCVVCGRGPADDARVKLEVDHIVPVARGGRDDAANLQTLCRDCNRGKRDRM